MILEMALISFD